MDSLSKYIALKEAGVGELQPQEDGTFSVSYLPYNELTGLPMEITTITLNREELMSQKSQLEAQLAARDGELQKIEQAKNQVQQMIEKIENVLSDMDAVSLPVPVVLAQP